QTLIRAQRGGMDSVQPYLKSLVEKDHPATPLILEALTRGYLRAYRFGDAAFMLALWRDRWPGDPPADLLEGCGRQPMGPDSRAIEHYQRVLEQDSEHDEARQRLANLLLETARPAEALEHLERLAETRPQDPLVQVRLARCLWILGRPQEAVERLDGVLA